MKTIGTGCNRTINILRLATLLAAGSLIMGAVAQAQSPGDLDSKKARRELKVMSGILSTTMQFLSDKEKQAAAAMMTSRGVESFYLAKQGAVFVLSLPKPSGVRQAKMTWEGLPGFEALVVDASRFAQAQAANQQSSEEAQAKAASLRERLRELQEKAVESLRSREELAQDYQERVNEVMSHLLEAVANYGDSLTHVKEGEYVNLVIRSGKDSYLYHTGGLAIAGIDRERRASDYVTIPKRLITAYKAQEISLDQFKDRVIAY